MRLVEESWEVKVFEGLWFDGGIRSVQRGIEGWIRASGWKPWGGRFSIHRRSVLPTVRSVERGNESPHHGGCARKG